MFFKQMIFWALAIFFSVITPVVIVRVILKKHELKNIKPAKTLELVKKTKLITFQEIILTAGVIGLFFTFIGLKQNQTTLQENIENFEVRNRPYIFIKRIDGKLNEKKTGLVCRVAITNTGAVPGLKVKIKGEVKYGEETTQSEDTPNYTALYPDSIVWSRFGFPIQPTLVVEADYEIFYLDYRGYEYEYEATFRYNHEFRSFTMLKSDEHIKRN